jgi:hypothetical protein
VSIPASAPSASPPDGRRHPPVPLLGRQKPDEAMTRLALASPRLSVDNTKATLRMYGPIDSWGGSGASRPRRSPPALDSLDDTVTEIQLRVNSPGGSWSGRACDPQPAPRPPGQDHRRGRRHRRLRGLLHRRQLRRDGHEPRHPDDDPRLLGLRLRHRRDHAQGRRDQRQDRPVHGRAVRRGRRRHRRAWRAHAGRDLVHRQRGRRGRPGRPRRRRARRRPAVTAGDQDPTRGRRARGRPRGRLRPLDVPHPGRSKAPPRGPQTRPQAPERVRGRVNPHSGREPRRGIQRRAGTPP